MGEPVNTDAIRWIERLHKVRMCLLAVFDFTSGMVEPFRNTGGGEIAGESFEEAAVALMVDGDVSCDPEMVRMIINLANAFHSSVEFSFSVPVPHKVGPAHENVAILRNTAYEAAVDAAVELISSIPIRFREPMVNLRIGAMWSIVAGSEEFLRLRRIAVAHFSEHMDAVADFLHDEIQWDVREADRLMLKVKDEFIRVECAIRARPLDVPKYLESRKGYRADRRLEPSISREAIQQKRNEEGGTCPAALPKQSEHLDLIVGDDCLTRRSLPRIKCPLTPLQLAFVRAMIDGGPGGITPAAAREIHDSEANSAGVDNGTALRGYKRLLKERLLMLSISMPDGEWRLIDSHEA